MILTGVHLEGVGKFAGAVHLKGLGAGINLLSARNEAGKSTIFRAIRICLFEKHTAKSSDVSALASAGLSLPMTIMLDFEHEGHSYQVSKSFVRSPAASLRRNGVEIAKSRAADDALWEVLGLQPGSGKSIDQAAYGVLWVGQGQSFHMPDPSEAATSALASAIQHEVGTLVGGERARQVIGAVGNELSELVTERGQPRTKGPLGEADRELKSVEDELRVEEDKLNALDMALIQLHSERSAANALAASPIEAELEAELHAVSAALSKAIADDNAAKLLQAEKNHSQVLLDQAMRDHESLTRTIDRIDKGRARLDELAAQIGELNGREAPLQHELAEARAAMLAIDGELDACKAKADELKRLQAASKDQAERQRLGRRLDILTDYETRRLANAAAVKVNGVTKGVIAELDRIMQALTACTSKMEAQAAQLVIVAAKDAAVAINGRSVEAGTVRAVTEPLNVTIDQNVSIMVAPSNHDIAALQQEEATHRAKLSALLAVHGTSTPAELRKHRLNREKLEEDEASLQAEARLLGVEGQGASEVAKLKESIQQIEAGHQKLLQSWSGVMPDLAEIESRLTELETNRRALEARRRQQEQVALQKSAAAGGVTSQREALAGQRSEVESQLAGNRAAVPDGERSEILNLARDKRDRLQREHEAVVLKLADMRQRMPDPNEIERLRNRQERLQTSLANHRAEVNRQRERIARLEGEVAIAGGEGLGERVADLQARRDLCMQELQHQTNRTETLKLLRDTVEDCYRERREELNAPLRRHLTPFLCDLFPKADVDIGEDFAVKALRRSGPSAEEIELLSAGTQEQIAVLVRLAMGSMLSERGQEIPIILDDALVFSDDDRIEQMFDTLNRAASKQQVIVLTCRSRTFATLGGRTVSLVEGKPASGS